MSDELVTRRQLLGWSIVLGSYALTRCPIPNAQARVGNALVEASPSRQIQDDLAINETTSLLFSDQAPLLPAEGLRDSRAVWANVPAHVEKSVLVFLHGNDNYVTVDANGKSRVPDWATTEEARQGAASKPAAPLIYNLDALPPRHRPLVLVPEAATLSTKTFWAREPAGQYAEAARLSRLISDCKAHLAALHRPSGKPYLGRKLSNAKPSRVYLCGHSGAGLPLEEAALSASLLPAEAIGADLWLLDSTYWSKVTGFVAFCQQWHDAKRLGGKRPNCARFVCVYKGNTQTEAIANSLRLEIAQLLGVPATSLLHEHRKDTPNATLRAALEGSSAAFVRTDVSHDNIPKVFIPLLLDTAAS